MRVIIQYVEAWTPPESQAVAMVVPSTVPSVPSKQVLLRYSANDVVSKAEPLPTPHLWQVGVRIT